jgi:uncharacterized metal-binding protein
MENQNITVTNDHGMWQVKIFGKTEYQCNHEGTARLLASTLEDLENNIAVGNKMGDAIVGTLTQEFKQTVTYTIPSKMNDWKEDEDESV